MMGSSLRRGTTQQCVGAAAAHDRAARGLVVGVASVLIVLGLLNLSRRRATPTSPPLLPPHASLDVIDADSLLNPAWRASPSGAMAATLVHELNQPLSAITNYLRAARSLIARMELKDDELLEAVAKAGDQSVRAGEILRAMRELATQGGKTPKPVSLSAMIGETEVIISRMARDADVRVCRDLYKGDDTVMADHGQIQQLIVNLVRNAVEAVSKHPRRQINISTQADVDDQLVTRIEDSGPGIDPSVAERLFRPPTSPIPETMGLGLSISSAIVRNHRGRIWVEPSRLGGAAFCFVLARAGSNGDVSD